MADNSCSSLEPWSFHSAFADFSDALSRETETLTRALQMSLSADADVLAHVVASGGGGCSPFLVKPEPAASLSASDVETAAPKRIRNPALYPPAGKIAKRKSRASKRSTTTYITADPTNFRQMVQQVTGIRFAGGPHEDAVLKPEPQRAGGSRVPLLQGSCLPTLDTSSFLLDRAAWTPASSTAPSPPSHGSSFGSPTPEPATGFDLDPPFPSCFPTLESWGIM